MNYLKFIEKTEQESHMIRISLKLISENGVQRSICCKNLQSFAVPSTVPDKSIGRGKEFMVGRYGIEGYCVVYVCACV